MEPLLERLNRWADSLPVSEEIPIVDDEVLALAEYEDGRYGTPEATRITRLLECILKNQFVFRGHRVVVI